MQEAYIYFYTPEYLCISKSIFLAISIVLMTTVNLQKQQIICRYNYRNKNYTVEAIVPTYMHKADWKFQFICFVSKIQVPGLGPKVEIGGPYEYLHSPQAMHLSTSMLLSRVQNLQDQTFNFLSPLPLFFGVPRASHVRASDCNNEVSTLAAK